MFVRDLPRFSPAETAAIDRPYRKRIRFLQAVDRGVAQLVHTLKVTRQLDNTYIVFASDNGFHLGQHRMPAGKQTAYESDIHVPLLVRGPGVRVGAHESRLAGNTDLAPTFEAMAGCVPRRSPTADRSCPCWRGTRRRTGALGYLVEHRNEAGEVRPPRADTGKPSTLEPPDPDEIARANGRPPREIRDEMLLNRGAQIPHYDAVRTGRYLYAEYGNGDRELYDLAIDPDEIHNLAGTRPQRERTLAQRVTQLRNCGGAVCRTAENRAAA